MTALLMLTACGAPRLPHPALIRPAQLRVSTGQVTDLNPLTAHSPTNLAACSMIYDTLVNVSPSGSVQPRLAARWMVDAAGTRVVLDLNAYAKWWNGRPVTAADVVWSLNLEHALNPGLLGDIASVSAVNATTVSVRLRHPDPGFIANSLSPLGHSWILPSFLLRHRTTSRLTHSRFLNDLHNIVGTGPYRPVAWSGERLRWVANPRYFLGGPHIRTMSWWWVTPPATHTRGARLVQSWPPRQAVPTGWHQVDVIEPQYVALVLSGPGAASARPRLAANLDRSSLIHSVWASAAVPAFGPFLPASSRPLPPTRGSGAISPASLAGLQIAVAAPSTGDLHAVGVWLTQHWTLSGAVARTVAATSAPHGLLVRVVAVTAWPYPTAQQLFPGAASHLIYLAWPLRELVYSPDLSGVVPNPFDALYLPQDWRLGL